MTNVLRIPLYLYNDISECLTHDSELEQGCFLFCHEANTDKGQYLLVTDLMSLTSDDCITQKHDQLSVSPNALLRATRKAQKTGTSLCFVHTHPMCDSEVSFSIADDIGNIRTFDFINRMLPNRHNSALVFNGRMSAVSGRVYNEHGTWSVMDVITVTGHPYLLTTGMTCIDNMMREVV